MAITRIAAAPGLPTNFPFSLAGGVEGICFISGMPAVEADGTFTSRPFVEEMESAWGHVVAVAQAAGYSAEEILYVQCVLADIGDYSELNDWWRRQFPDVGSAPARFTYQAGALPFGAKIEFQAVAGR